MEGTLRLDRGVISARVEDGAFMDAATCGNMGGIEVAVVGAAVYVGDDESYRSDLTLALAMSPDEMNRLLTVLAEKLGQPAFNEREWRLIASALADDRLITTAVREGQTTELRELASRIERAYEPGQ